MPESRSASAELVVTAPEPLLAQLVWLLSARTTLGVLTELFATSRTRLVVGAPFIQGSSGLFVDPLKTALSAALSRGVLVDLISTGESLDALPMALFRRSNLRTYRPRGNILNPGSLGSHAKFCIADGLHAYLGSANLTRAIIDANLELGVLLHGPPVQQLSAFVELLFDKGYFVEVSSSRKP